MLMAFETPLVHDTKEYVRGFIDQHFTERICYHNIDHTLDVVAASEKIGRACKLSHEELEMVIIAAWFHDTGYYLGESDHEVQSAKIARDFLINAAFPKNKIRLVESCIMATKVPQNPQNNLEKVLCDADLFHLATDHFFEKSQLLLQELQFQWPELNADSWMNKSCEFIQCHHYHTDFGKKHLRPRKYINLKMLEEKLSQFNNLRNKK